MKQLEQNLSQALEKIDQLEGSVPQERAVSSESPIVMAGHWEQTQLGEIPHFVDGTLDLPPLNETLLAVEKYLATLNVVIPPFHPGRLVYINLAS
jgi:hypothetical protein